MSLICSALCSDKHCCLPQLDFFSTAALSPNHVAADTCDPLAVEAGVRGPSQSVVQAYLGFQLGVWSYNSAVKYWEPVVEPWSVIAQCAANYGLKVGGVLGAEVDASSKRISMATCPGLVELSRLRHPELHLPLILSCISRSTSTDCTAPVSDMSLPCAADVFGHRAGRERHDQVVQRLCVHNPGLQRPQLCPSCVCR